MGWDGGGHPWPGKEWGTGYVALTAGTRCLSLDPSNYQGSLEKIWVLFDAWFLIYLF